MLQYGCFVVYVRSICADNNLPVL
uniref:Uncharacterized protein n=1 Tax=Arundo donax TaxID=35708 RepID=A0A0A8Z9D3_ARUDO